MKVEKLLRESKGIISLQGREYVTFRGLLWVAHQAGLESIEVELVSWDADTQAAICRATVKGERGTFSDIGDASPANVNRMVASACLRMASTRSQARALRSYLGVGITSLEELPGDAPTRSAQLEGIDPQKAARWAVDVGAFERVGDALKEIKALVEAGHDPQTIRGIWVDRCTGGEKK